MIAAEIAGNISYPYGDSNYTLRVVYLWSRMAKHFIPLWGQQPKRANVILVAPPGNISYPYGDSNGSAPTCAAVTPETFHIPMGTATLGIPLLFLVPHRKHFIPLWGQQLDRLSIRAK